LPDGNIEYLGRNDDQVKIRGFRVELGEIEARLGEYGLRDVAVIARQDAPGEKRLVAYYTGEAQPVEALRAHLRARLPEYMVPAAYVALASMPLTPNGKLDRRALPAPEGEAFAQRVYEAPQGEIEQTLAAIWAELLGVERIGRYDHFFELGGHSLLAVQLMEQLRSRGLGTEIRTMFAKPVLAELAATLGSHREAAVPPNQITPDSTLLTPSMLPLADLTQADIDRIVARVPGGLANLQDVYALSPLQDGILFHHLLASDGDPYLLVGRFAFANRDVLDRYLAAVQRVVERHDILRTAFLWEGLSSPVQVVLRHAPLNVTEVELDAGRGNIIEQLASRFDPRHHRIDLTRAPLLRFVVAPEPGTGRWLALQLLHHLVGDHTTLEITHAEVQAMLEGRDDVLKPPQPFRNAIAQMRLGLSLEEHEAFFRTQLADIDEPTLPFGLDNVHQEGRRTREAYRSLPQTLNAKLRAHARRLGVSLASLCHLAWAQVIARTSGRTSVVFGTVLFGRMHGGMGADRAMGVFINTLPLRLDVDDTPVIDSVRLTHERLARLLQHEHASLALAQRCSGVPAPAPLFSALLNYRHNLPVQDDGRESVMPAFDGIEWLGGEERTNYPLGLSVEDSGQALGLTAQSVDTISPERICGYMQQALTSLARALDETPQLPVRQLDVLPPDERTLLLKDWNETAAPLADDLCIHQIFERQVQRTPEAEAVVFGETSLTYGALNARANQIAHRLMKQGIGPDDRVAICVERSVEMVAGVLGVLKAGAAYVPIDSNYPDERIRYTLADSAPAVVLVHAATHERVAGLAPDRPVWALDASGWDAEPQDNPVAGIPVAGTPVAGHVEPHHLAYVIYTSGSTGQPKGVMVEHRHVCNLVFWHRQAFALSQGQRVSSVAGFGFDAASWEIWAALCSGSTLLLAPAHAGSADVPALLDWWRSQTLDVSFLPTPIAELAFAEGAPPKGLRVLLVGGDRLRRLPPWAQSVSIVNNYGPTENTVVASSGQLRSDDTVLHIGRPISNTRIHILDARHEPVPLGVVGEIFIAGSQVARGYLNRPELTAERFIRDPFAEDAGAMMYRTGDLARYLPDGNIEYIGRNDDQVKIR
ncbi:MAG TPA: amino acid adenylation domain-containing protein, partial [Trinickia sp.]|nr:amino acid adenylation domain-containing protein [Trinickia sp.]